MFDKKTFLKKKNIEIKFVQNKTVGNSVQKFWNIGTLITNDYNVIGNLQNMIVIIVIF